MSDKINCQTTVQDIQWSVLCHYMNDRALGEQAGRQCVCISLPYVCRSDINVDLLEWILCAFLSVSFAHMLMLYYIPQTVKKCSRKRATRNMVDLQTHPPCETG